MAASLTCRFCEATIRPPGGRVEAVTHCPWCAADLRTPPAGSPAASPREARPVGPADPAPSPGGGIELAAAGGILAASAVVAVGAFFAARWLMRAAG